MNMKVNQERNNRVLEPDWEYQTTGLSKMALQV